MSTRSIRSGTLLRQENLLTLVSFEKEWIHIHFFKDKIIFNIAREGYKLMKLTLFELSFKTFAQSRNWCSMQTDVTNTHCACCRWGTSGCLSASRDLLRVQTTGRWRSSDFPGRRTKGGAFWGRPSMLQNSKRTMKIIFVAREILNQPNDYLSAGVNFLYPFWTHRLWLDATRRFPDGTGMGRFVMLWSIYKDLSFFQKTNLVGKKKQQSCIIQSISILLF